jgi:hypothetical protein
MRNESGVVKLKEKRRLALHKEEVIFSFLNDVRGHFTGDQKNTAN